MHLLFPLVLSALLFAVGIYGLLARRNAVLLLMSVELMLNAVNLDLVAFDVWLRDNLHNGQTLTLFVITVAAAEVGLGLAIVLQVFRVRATVAIDELVELAEPDTQPALPPDQPAAVQPGAVQPGAVRPAGPATARRPGLAPAGAVTLGAGPAGSDGAEPVDGAPS
ncbi:MAG TPA: NADH-quinone oxidoreductase subunit NuoK [Mycobacteriales bacterium]|nr:NADH-quinone oxidoreductase subunit NuoK [Mycobacteriales bacterium]